MPKTDSVAVLRECPFCGGEARIAHANMGYGPSYYVRCVADCHGGCWADAESAAADWNRRAALSAQGERTVAESAQAIHAAVASGQQPRASDMHKVFGDPRVSVTVPAAPGGVGDAVTEGIDMDVLHGAIAYFNGLNTKAARHMASEIGKCCAALAARTGKGE